MSTVGIDEMTSKAVEMGKEYGEMLGAWVVDSTNSKEYCAKIIEGFEDGDPEILDLCPSPLSGEFAGGPTTYSVLKELGFDPAVPKDYHDKLIDAYEESFSDAWWDTVIQKAYFHHGDYEPCGVCKKYGHKSKDHE